MTSLPNIPILDLSRQYQQLQPAVDAAVLKVMASGTFILGPEVHAFEREAADYCGTTYAIGCASGTDALFLALKALGVGAGDEVLTTAFSYIATSESIVRTGARPVFIDMEPSGTFNFDVQQLKAAITPRTRAILPVHLYGQAVNMDVLMQVAREHNLFVVEDCAQAMGAEWNGRKVGSFGDAGCFSFFPTKNLGCYGDGGLVTCQSTGLAEKIKILRAHGSAKRYYHDIEGVNSRLDEIQAAILRVKLPYLNDWNARRLQIAQAYSERLKSLPGVTVPVIAPEAQHVFHQYTLQIDAAQAGLNRDTLQEILKQAGVMSMIYYPVPLHLQGTHQNLGYQSGSLPVTELAAERVLSLPIFPELNEAEIDHITGVIRSAIESSRLTTA